MVTGASSQTWAKGFRAPVGAVHAHATKWTQLRTPLHSGTMSCLHTAEHVGSLVSGITSCDWGDADGCAGRQALTHLCGGMRSSALKARYSSVLSVPGSTSSCAT